MTSKALCLVALMASFAGSLGCGSSSAPEKSGNVEVFSWWTAGGEADALQKVITLDETKYPKVKITNAAVALGDQARATLTQRMSNAQPPDLFQANIGYDLLQWAGTSPKIESLNSLVKDQGWSFYPDIIKSGNLSEASGSLYGIPVDIHRINSLFINLPVLTRNHIDPKTLTSLTALNTACTTLKGDTTLLAPMNIGSKFQWTLDILIFENVLPAVAGGQFYEDYFRGKNTAPGTDPNITAMLTEAATLWTFMPSGARSPNSIDWTDAIDDFVAGKVGFTVMGDWAKGLMDKNGLKAGVDYDEIPFPAADGITQSFVYTSDTFALPIGAKSRDLALDFLTTFGSDAGQVAFNVEKGSIPPRTLADTSGFDAVSKKTIAAYEASTDRHVALSGIVPGDFNTPVYQALFNFAASCEAGTCNAKLVTDALAANYGLLQQ